MIINYLPDRDLGDLVAIYAAIGRAWQWVMIRFEDQTVWPPQIDSELPVSVLPEVVAATWRALQVAEGRSGVKHR
jgi:hypothetical protein